MLVLLRCEHIALGVNRVVVAPVGDGGHGNGGGKRIFGICDAHQRLVSSIAPAVDAYARTVDTGEGGDVAAGVDLVDGLAVAEVLVDAVHELATAGTGAASVNTGHDEAVVGEVLHPAGLPGVQYGLRARAAVLVHDNGVFPRGVEVTGTHNPSVEFATVRGHLDKFLPGQFCAQALAQRLVVGEDAQ